MIINNGDLKGAVVEKAPGGWILLVPNQGLLFISDPNHSWEWNVPEKPAHTIPTQTAQLFTNHGLWPQAAPWISHNSCCWKNNQTILTDINNNCCGLAENQWVKKLLFWGYNQSQINCRPYRLSWSGQATVELKGSLADIAKEKNSIVFTLLGPNLQVIIKSVDSTDPPINFCLTDDF